MTATELTAIESDVLASVRREAAPIHKIGRACRIPPGVCLDALNRLIEAGLIERHAVVAHLGSSRWEIFYRARYK